MKLTRDTQRIGVRLLLAVALLAVVMPMCVMVACSMPMLASQCDSMYTFSEIPPALFAQVLALFTAFVALVLFSAPVQASALSRLEPIRIEHALAQDPPDDPLKGRLRL